MKNKSSRRAGKGTLYLPYKFMILLSCLFAMACSRENGVEPLSEGSGGDAIRLGASVNLQTRATNAGFELGDTVGLYLAKWSDASTPGVLSGTGNHADNAPYRLASLPDSWATPQPLYYPADGGKLDFYAYYPYRTPAFGTGTTLGLSVSPDQSAYRDYTRSDFMVARAEGVKRSTSKVHLDFYHRLSQIVFVVKPGVGFTTNDLKRAQVKVVNAIVDGTFDLAQKKDTVVAGTTRRDVTPCGSWVETNGTLTGVMAILMPQHTNATTYIELTVGSRKFTFKPSAPAYMKSGCSREFAITVNNTGIEIETTIHPWNTCPPVAGDAAEEEDTDVIVRMTTTKENPTFTVGKTGDIEVDWGDGVREKNVFKHTYVDGLGSHEIVFRGSDKVLTRLDCNKNLLTLLDVSRNTALTSLVCNYNQLTILNVLQNTALTSLICGYNQLTYLDVSQNIALKKLDCYNNQLTRLDVLQNTALANLDCDSNQLTTLDVSQNIALRTLGCYDNQLTILDVSRNTALVNLWCENNRLVELNVSQNTALKSLDCFNNQLTRLDVSQNTVLDQLNCNNNRLTDFDISKNLSLTTLDCHNNPFVSDPTELATMANGLPDRTGKTKGTLSIANLTAQAGIQNICDAKNWEIE